MKHDCHYHSGDFAKWHCGECQIHYCSRCMPDADTRQRRALCPHCSKAMRYLGAATEVVPFWQRLGAFFRYPFHTDPLIVIAVCTLVPVVAPANLIGILIGLVLALALFKYTYAVINHTAEGHLKPPAVSVAFTGSGFDIVILQLLVFVLMGGLADRNDGGGIADVLNTLRQAEPGFKLDDPDLSVRCARALYHRGQFKPALRVLQDFHKRFPDSEQLAPAYLLVAQTLANGLSQWEKATAFLTFIQKKCMNHPLHEQIEVYLKQAENRKPLKGPRAIFSVEG